jgi:DNA-binding NarL/FixJ family response regulator
MPGEGGIATVRKITASGGCSAVVMLSVFDDPALVLDASHAGARGYVLKSRAGTDLAPAFGLLSPVGKSGESGPGCGVSARPAWPHVALKGG